jgi:hypothetical protein
MTKRDAIVSALAVAEDIDAGRIDPAVLDAELADRCRGLVGTVVGEGDPLWPLQIDITRQVLGLGGVPTTELAEWLAVGRHPAGDPDMPVDADSTASGDPVADSAPSDGAPDPIDPQENTD